MTPHAVVEPFDLVEDGRAGVLPSGPDSAVQQLGFEWQAVQSPTDATDGGRAGGGVEVRHSGLGALNEQLNGGRPQQVVSCGEPVRNAQ
jgi:hypothetical protein